MATDIIRRPARPSPWRNPAIRGIVLQVLFVAAVLALGAFLVHNTLVNLRRQNIASGFGFLDREAAFGIGESLIAYSPADTYGRAFLVGLLNTLYVAGLGVVLATVLGTVMGLARLSPNWLIRKLAQVYVETFRNIPLLLQLFFWWGLLREAAPAPRQAWQLLPDVFVSNRGIVFPVPSPDPAHGWMLLAMGIGAAATIAILRWARQRQGDAVSPEFAALLLGLVVYTGTFIAEIVRAGILAVSHGQSEAAMALGFKPGQRMRLIVLPQALRVIIPPMTSQYLSLTKSSVLAVAIGYPDLFSVAGTTINQTGQAVEGIAMIMAVYLTISLIISLLMNLYNRSVALVER